MKTHRKTLLGPHLSFKAESFSKALDLNLSHSPFEALIGWETCTRVSGLQSPAALRKHVCGSFGQNGPAQNLVFVIPGKTLTQQLLCGACPEAFRRELRELAAWVTPRGHPMWVCGQMAKADTRLQQIRRSLSVCSLPPWSAPVG